MGLKITVDHPSYPKGHEFGINGVGVVKNGDSVTISDAQAKSALQERNALSPEDDQLKTVEQLFTSAHIKTSKVADPAEPAETSAAPTEGGGEG
jgi:hypothetical protein